MGKKTGDFVEKERKSRAFALLFLSFSTKSPAISKRSSLFVFLHQFSSFFQFLLTFLQGDTIVDSGEQRLRNCSGRAHQVRGNSSRLRMSSCSEC